MTLTLSDLLKHEDAKAEELDSFFPVVPESIEQTGLNRIFVEDLICKLLHSHGSLNGRELSAIIGLPLKLFKNLLYDLKQRLILSHQATSGIDDFVYALTEQGVQKALLAREQSNYLGTLPVPFSDYLASIDKQSINTEKPKRTQLEIAFDGLVLPDQYFDSIGPAVNSGRGMFIYGAPGNGKTEIATRIAKCFTETIFIPRTVIVEGTLIQIYDPQCHTKVRKRGKVENQDQRWLEIERPAVVVGGEMDLDSLEIGYNEQTKVSEASLQLKGNNGVFVIDDFGRQRVGPATLLNRWVLPLEKKIDYLTLPSGNKIMVPFNALLVFCSNLDPGGFLDEAFLRRIPYKIHIQDPSEMEFRQIFQQEAKKLAIDYDDKTVDYFLDTHYRGVRPLRSCHPRDILQQIVNIASYSEQPVHLSKSNLDKAVALYFSSTGSKEK